MSVDHILSAIDEEIDLLQEARRLLGGATFEKSKSGPSPSTASAPKRTPKKRTLSAEARKRIAEAQRKRWAAHRKGTGKGE
jgi:hypothetical protein